MAVVASCYDAFTGATTITSNLSGSSTIGAGAVGGDSLFLNGIGSDSTTLVTITGSTTITAALHANRTLLLNKAGTEVTCTLPAATGTGNTYKFMQQAVNTSKYHILALAGDLMCGNIVTNSSTDTQSLQPWISLAATANIRCTLNGTTTGGVGIGDWVRVVDIATDTWAIDGLTTTSGMEATPFATS